MKPYNDPSRTQSEEVRDMFDRIAPRYDLLNHLLSAGIDRLWRRRTVRTALSDRPLRLLDMATGTGDLAIALARKAAPEAHVTGVDPSEGMLAVARRKVAAKGLADRISLRTGAAEALTGFAENTFDAATVAFGVRNFSDRTRGLAELCRVLRPGGRVTILEFSTPTTPLLRTLYRWYFHRLLPCVGGAVSKERPAYEYLPASVDAFPDPEAFAAQLREAGFGQVRFRRLSFGIAAVHTGIKC